MPRVCVSVDDFCNSDTRQGEDKCHGNQGYLDGRRRWESHSIEWNEDTEDQSGSRVSSPDYRMAFCRTKGKVRGVVSRRCNVTKKECDAGWWLHRRSFFILSLFVASLAWLPVLDLSLSSFLTRSASDLEVLGLPVLLCLPFQPHLWSCVSATQSLCVSKSEHHKQNEISRHDLTFPCHSHTNCPLSIALVVVYITETTLVT